MSGREENDYDRQFQADLQKAIALSLETSEYERLKNERRKKGMDSSEGNNNSRKNSVEMFPKSRPRPETTVKTSSTLLPPPSTSRKNSATSSVSDLITFTSPKDEAKGIIRNFDDVRSLETSKLPDAFGVAGVHNHNSKLPLNPCLPLSNNSNNSLLPFRPIGFSALEKDLGTDLVNQYPNNHISNYGFKPEVTNFQNNFTGRKHSLQYNIPPSVGPSSSLCLVSGNIIGTNLKDMEGQRGDASQNSIDILKVIGKQRNNNLIDLVPLNFGDSSKSSADKTSVLEQFDPLLEGNGSSTCNDTNAPQECSTDGDTRRGAPVSGQATDEAKTVISKDDENEDCDFDDTQSACSESFYDPFDPFDYMNTSSVDGSLGEPIYTTVVKLDKGSPLPMRSASRKSIFEATGHRTYKLCENIYKKKAVFLNSDTLAFYEMVKELRAQFLYTDLYTNVGLVISPTIENNYAVVTSVKLVVHSSNHQQPVSFTCDLSSSVEHVIVQVICSFEGDIRNSVSDYVLKVYGLSEYLTSETCLGDYEYVHQCIKLEKDVTLSIIQISELKRPLARTARDDNSLKNLVIEDLLPSETAQPITYDTLRILLETIEREMDNTTDAISKLSSSSSSHSHSIQPIRVQQAIKAVCALMGHVETVDITDALNSFTQICTTISSKTTIDDFRANVTSDDGDYSIVQIGSSALRNLKDNFLLQCDRIREALRGLIESYCHAFNVDFALTISNQPPIVRKSILEFQDTILVNVGSLHRLQGDWSHTAYAVSAQIYHGPRAIKETNACMTNITKPSSSFYNRVVFDSWLNLRGTTVACLPRESRLVLTLFGLTLLPPDHEQSRANPGQPQYEQVELGWTAIQFFNYEGVLTQGSFLLSIWEPVANKRFSPAPTPGANPVQNHPVLHISLPDYGGTVVFPELPKPTGKAPMYEFNSLDVNTQQLLINISEQDSYAKAKKTDREILWEKRHYLHNIPQALPKVLLATQNWDFSSLSDLHSMVHSWSPMEPLPALQLLLPCFPDAVVRSVAISWIKDLGSDELVDYLPQLVQALKHETYDTSPLAKFLLERALTSPRVAHYLYWLLVQTLPGSSPQNSTEVVSGDECTLGAYRYHRRLQIMLRSLLAISGETLVQRLMAQQVLVKNLYEVAENIKRTKESLRLKALQSGLEVLHHSLQESPAPLPLSLSVSVEGIQVRTSSYFPSNTLPLKINFISDEAKIFPAIFKIGDYLQQDMLTMQVIRIMDKMWLKEGLDLKMVTFTCLPTGHKRGMIELVESAETLRKIQVEHGLTGSFKDRPIAEWLGKHNPSTLEYERAVRNFTASCAGYSVATYILGICDRHNDNIMLKTSGHLFHIDFGKFLGDAQMFGNFKRDRSPFVLTSDMAYVINGGDKPSQKFHHFVDLCCRAFCIVRKHGNIILNLFGLMVSSGIPGVTLDAVHYVQRALLPDKSDPEASAIFARMIDSSLKSWFTQLNFFLHNLSQLRFTGDHNDGDLLSFIPKRYTCEEEGRILQVKVHGCQKRYDSEKYYIYILKVDRENQPNSTYLFRKYKEFCEFHQKLCTMFPLAKCYSLPSGLQIGRSNTQQVAERRKVDIEKFLVSLFKMADEIAHSDIVYTFFHPLLRDEEEEVDINKKKVKGPKVTQENESHIIKGQLKLSIQYRRDTLVVMVHHARGLPKLAAGQEPSTYVKVYLKPDNNKSTKRKTKVVRKNCHPSFMEMLEYRLPLEVIRQRTLEATIWSHDTLQENEFLGGVLLSLHTFPLEKETCEWYSLDNLIR
ncbi:hypothetical protein RUM43_006451 [Polyplax serrata]|uniref:Phosphatidylinositol-4-phosphate 3-kinase n=1 Tax=Polyplax serrata TaxID=468196 RepID=A0AAN8PBH0_POLSC